MSVVRRDTRRRWAIVVAAVAVLVAIPLVLRAVPAGATSIAPDTLAARIAASARQPYQGYAVSTGSAGLPSLPQLDDVIGLFDGNTSLRIWYADPGRTPSTRPASVTSISRVPTRRSGTTGATS
jgi:hypothetical protein